MDLRNYATGPVTPSEQRPIAGKVKMNSKGDVGARLNIEAFVKFSPEGNLLLSLGDNNTVTIEPEHREKIVLYKFAGTLLSASKRSIGNVLAGVPNTECILNAPPLYVPDPNWTPSNL